MNRSNLNHNYHKTTTLFILLSIIFLVSIQKQIPAQTFSSDSDGSDGDLTFSPGDPQPIIFAPQALGLDTNNDGIYHFGTITVPEGVTVRLGADVLGTRPVIWLATGDVEINGVLDLNGQGGHDGANTTPRVPAIAGAGGYSGGIGGTTVFSGSPGSGPGGGRHDTTRLGPGGGGAGHAVPGELNDFIGGRSYGNPFLLPLLGGSGGAGGFLSIGGGGGAGGGALLIASSTQVTVNGTISAKGGNGGNESISRGSGGGGGSGGAIRLMANSIDGGGVLSVSPGLKGDRGGSDGAHGRIRIEAFNQNFSGTVEPEARFVTPGLVFPPTDGPSIKVARVAGEEIPEYTNGSFSPADLNINESDPVEIEKQAENIPITASIRLYMYSETEGITNISTSALSGTFEASKATATTTIPHGFSRFSIEASWNPQ